MCIADTKTNRDEDQAKLIEVRFSTAADRYDLHALVQKQAATELAQWIRSSGGYFRQAGDLSPTAGDEFIRTHSAARRKTKTGEPVRALELGCGTGLLSEILLEHSPPAHWVLSDIAPGMLDACREKVNKIVASRSELQVDFQVLDISSFSMQNEFDLIASSFAMQWLPDIGDWLPRVVKGLRPGGKLFVNLLTSDSFEFWHRRYQAAKAAGKPFPQPPVLTGLDRLNSLLEELVVQFGAKMSYELRRNTIQQDHKGFLDFLGTLKLIGANSVLNHAGLSFAELKMWRSGFQDEPVQMNYEIVEIKLEIHE